MSFKPSSSFCCFILTKWSKNDSFLSYLPKIAVIFVDFADKKRGEVRVILAMKIMQDNDLYYEFFASGGAGGFRTPPVLLPSAFGGRVACAPAGAHALSAFGAARIRTKNF